LAEHGATRHLESVDRSRHPAPWSGANHSSQGGVRSKAVIHGLRICVEIEQGSAATYRSAKVPYVFQLQIAGDVADLHLQFGNATAVRQRERSPVDVVVTLLEPGDSTSGEKREKTSAVEGISPSET
jgi:hypothetical protein